MGVIVIALKNVKACTVLQESQKMKIKIVEQNANKTSTQDWGGDIRTFLKDELGTNWQKEKNQG